MFFLTTVFKGIAFFHSKKWPLTCIQESRRWRSTGRGRAGAPRRTDRGTSRWRASWGTIPSRSRFCCDICSRQSTSQFYFLVCLAFLCLFSMLSLVVYLISIISNLDRYFQTIYIHLLSLVVYLYTIQKGPLLKS